MANLISSRKLKFDNYVMWRVFCNYHSSFEDIIYDVGYQLNELHIDNALDEMASVKIK